MTAFSDDGLSAIATKLGNPLMLDSYTSYMCIQSWGMSSYAREMIELRSDVELKDTIRVAMSKLVGEGSNCLLFVLSMSGNLSGVRVSRPISNKISASTSGKKKQAELSSQKVSNSNPFDALNSTKDGDDLGTNGGNSKSAENGSLNVVHGSSNNTPIIEKIDKLERQILDGKLMFVDDDGKPLYKVVSKGNEDSESEVEVIFDETANLMASTSLKANAITTTPRDMGAIFEHSIKWIHTLVPRMRRFRQMVRVLHTAQLDVTKFLDYPMTIFQNEDEALKAKIISHPHYSNLLQAYMDCQKVGAPPEIAGRLVAVRQEYEARQQQRAAAAAAAASNVYKDPELDQFMDM
nr:homeobox protein knotted-1-like 2 [Tanacetum cinerariifolium]